MKGVTLEFEVEGGSGQVRVDRETWKEWGRNGGWLDNHNGKYSVRDCIEVLDCRNLKNIPEGDHKMKVRTT